MVEEIKRRNLRRRDRHSKPQAKTHLQVNMALEKKLLILLLIRFILCPLCHNSTLTLPNIVV